MPIKYADGSFKQRKYVLEYRFSHEGKRYSVYAKTQQECFNKRTEIICGKKKINNQVKIPSFSEWLTEWDRLYNNKAKAEKTILQNKGYIERIKKAIGEIQLNKLNGLDIQNYLMSMKEKTNTQNKIARIIKRAVTKAFDLGKIKLNPYKAVEIESHQSKKRRALTFQEQTLLYENINAKYKPLFKFACCTGLRISEILELKKSDIDFKEKIIYAKRKKKKKAKNNIFPIPFLDELFSFYNGTEIVFTEYTYEGFKSHLEKILRKLDIKDISIHCLRHTFASNCYASGIKDKVIQAWLGHESLAMTTDIYTHLIKNGTSEMYEYIKRLKEETNN